MSDERGWKMTVRARDGVYNVTVDDNAFHRFAHMQSPKRHVLIDERVADLYADELRLSNAYLIHTSEAAKSLDRLEGTAEYLLINGIRRDHEIVAIGGGVVQDVACFLAGTLLRGVPWVYYPTTLLAQVDLCIGGKSSINVGRFKNAMGTFTPPKAVWIVPHVLNTLREADMRSGVGEMLKVHAVHGPAAFDIIAGDYESLFTDRGALLDYAQRSLMLKRTYVEADEFDHGARRLLNYGHTFGHAIESATDYAVPHGIAVSLGMDTANYVASKLGFGSDTYERMHPTLAANFAGFEDLDITVLQLAEAMMHDKKNSGDKANLILPGKDGKLIEHACGLDKLVDALLSYSTAGAVCA